MRNIITIASLILIFMSCSNQKAVTNLKELDFEKFTIQAPISWKRVRVKGIDSYVGRIKMDLNDTVEFDLGYYSNDLSYVTKKTKVIWDTIDGYRAKIVVYEGPKSDLTGVYIGSLSGSNGPVKSFNFYGKNLKKENQTKFLSAIRTLKFRKEKL